MRGADTASQDTLEDAPLILGKQGPAAVFLLASRFEQAESGPAIKSRGNLSHILARVAVFASGVANPVREML